MAGTVRSPSHLSMRYLKFFLNTVLIKLIKKGFLLFRRPDYFTIRQFSKINKKEIPFRAICKPYLEPATWQLSTKTMYLFKIDIFCVIIIITLLTIKIIEVDF